MKKAGIALLVLGALVLVLSILFEVGLLVWVDQAVMERAETSPMSGQLDTAITWCSGCGLGLFPFVGSGGLFFLGAIFLATGLRSERRK